MVKMGAVWDRTTKFLRANSGAVLTIAGLAIFLPTVAGTVLQAALAGDEPTSTSAAGGIVSLITTIISMLGQIALVALAIDATLGTNGAFSVAGRRLLPVIGVSILVSLIFLLLFLPLIVILFGSGVDWAALQAGDASTMPEMTGGTALFLGLYTLVLVPVIFWLAARFSVIMPVVVWERLGVGAIGRTFRLTKGYALKIIGVFILFLIVFIVAGLAIGGVFGAILALTTDGVQGLTVGGILMAIIMGLLTVIFTVIYTVFLTKLYKSLIEETEPAAVFE